MRQRPFVIMGDGVEDGRIGWLDDVGLLELLYT